MSMIEQFHRDLKESIKAKEELRTSTLRMLISALQYRAEAVAKDSKLNPEQRDKRMREIFGL